MKLAYITVQTPYSDGEQFVPPEILQMKRFGNTVCAIPIRPESNNDGKSAEAFEVKKDSVYLPVIGKETIIEALKVYFQNFAKANTVLFNILTKSNSIKQMIKNLYVFPKGLATAKIVKEKGIEHIHAHWASTPSTVAYIASQISGISWSLTSHRHDIALNNMCKEKARTAKFFRLIDIPGCQEMMNNVGEYACKCNIIHCGINIPKLNDIKKVNNERFTIAVPARFVYKKGHIYLIEALKELAPKYPCECRFYGDGPLQDELEAKVKDFGLQNVVLFKGQIHHDELLSLYLKGEIDCVAVPSIVAEDGDREGIPVALMEPMAHRIPVIGTNTGGIFELLGDGSGIMIEEKNPIQLKNALEKLITDAEYRNELATKGYKKVSEEFSLPKVTERLFSLMR